MKFLSSTMILIAVVLLSSCSMTAKVWPPYDNITITASRLVNPDPLGEASPIQIKVYELSSRATLDNLGFDRAFNNAEVMLSAELISASGYTLQPGQTITHAINLTANSSYIAILAGFIDIDNAQWKHIYKIDPTGHYNHTISINESTITEGETVEEQSPSNQQQDQETSKNIIDETADNIGQARQTKDDVKSLLDI